VKDQWVILHRQGLNGRYYGALSCDGRSIVGTTSWYPQGMLWQASIDEGTVR
jgi:hypothetical protein